MRHTLVVHAAIFTPPAVAALLSHANLPNRIHDLRALEKGEKVRRFQYTAIDDATRVRALKVYEKLTQANAINFLDHVVEKFPLRIREITADNGHEFQAKFHWHVEDLGIRHAYIKRGTPQLNGKVERSQRSDRQEFY